ncbi:uncharacterized protein ALTATR162_LOCUS9077 [Alternaria atra]|uniref:Linalool dehydratase/isomerase domain-containing protein n=1 Tax=Alternaria atra TaxID=119953 RepID=A0A8J2N3A2_9PLEO|nr:uncharacterized protein ALTATR162_LOCUS9077 [Alternaria atra]CAG5179188.1 unnamed protein product [Alternaria atra]
MATITTIHEVLQMVRDNGLNAERENPPTKLPEDFLSSFPKLSNEQAGHLRHFHNLASQPDGEWHRMGAQDPGQEWFDAYRYQLATMAYATGSAHYHRLPAVRSVFKNLLEQLIHKMLRREVWGYWYLTSQSGKFVDPDLVEMRKPWADPNKQENIMYDQPEALTFNWDPIFWGFGPEKFTYTRSTLQEAILSEMERHNWKGVCCEPNSIFIVCNQFPIIAMRYNDIRDKTAVVDKVLKDYIAAWGKDGGYLQDDKFFINWYMVKQDRIVPGGIAITAWTSAFMNSWNSQSIHSLFPEQSVGFFTKAPGGRVNVNDEGVAKLIRELAKSEGADPQAWSTKEKAQKLAKKIDDALQAPFSQPVYGYVAQWEKGGLYYPRNDTQSDEQGNWKFVDPYTGNGAIAYARLNVPDGQKKMWEKPWSKEHFSGFPFVDGISLASDVDFFRGNWDSEKCAFVVTLRTWDGATKTIQFLVKNLPAGRYGIYRNGLIIAAQDVNDDSKTVEVFVEVGAEETDIVLLKSAY